MPLHRPGLLANRGLSDTVQLGSLGKALRLNEIGKYLEVLYLHTLLKGA